MTVKELIEKLQHFDPEMKVGSSDWLGQYVAIDYVDETGDPGDRFVTIRIETPWLLAEPEDQ